MRRGSATTKTSHDPLLAEAWSIINRLHGEFADHPAIGPLLKRATGLKIVIKESMRSYAGKAYCARFDHETDRILRPGWIDLNGPMFRDTWNYEKSFRDTVLHEFAHILTPNCRHNIFWKTVARAIGGNGTRCHRLMVVKGKFKGKQLYCSSCDATEYGSLSACRKCGQKLEPLSSRKASHGPSAIDIDMGIG